MDHLISLENISKKYDDKLVVDNISFDIKKSSINMLLGPNGSGKTTLSKIITGILKPSSGKIKKISSKIKIGYVPQKFVTNDELPYTLEDLISSLSITIEEVLKFNLIGELDIPHFLNKQISEFSGGQLQKILLSISLCNKPDLIVLDEPTSYLDLESTQNFYKIIENVREKYNTAILMVSHDLHTVMKTADQIICINHKICCQGTAFEEAENIIGNISIYNHKH